MRAPSAAWNIERTILQITITDSKRILQELIAQARTLFPLFRYLLLQTETHAFCLALACAALIGFYPFCALLLSLMKHQFHWQGGYDVVVQALQVFYPTSQDWLISNLAFTIGGSKAKFELGSMIWVFLGAAGVFIPLEAGLNRLWKVQSDRPYWRNQLVGLSLTVVCCTLAIAFVAIIATIQAIVGFPIQLLDYIWSGFDFIRLILNRVVLHATAVCFFSVTIFLFYKYLPNTRVETLQVLPAAILAGVAAEVVKDIYVIVLPWMDIGGVNGSQGPFYVSVSFVILAYFETFVVLGGAFLATQSEAYPWMGFIRRKKADEVPPSS
jgi:uncharacterized BrkB/YihY/UPF0761 family membrane protein